METKTHTVIGGPNPPETLKTVINFFKSLAPEKNTTQPHKLGHNIYLLEGNVYYERSFVGTYENYKKMCIAKRHIAAAKGQPVYPLEELALKLILMGVVELTGPEQACCTVSQLGELCVSWNPKEEIYYLTDKSGEITRLGFNSVMLAVDCVVGTANTADSSTGKLKEYKSAIEGIADAITIANLILLQVAKDETPEAVEAPEVVKAPEVVEAPKPTKTSKAAKATEVAEKPEVTPTKSNL